MATFPYLRIHFLNTRYAFQCIVHHQKKSSEIRHLPTSSQMSDEFVFRIRIELLNSFVALKSVGRSLGRRKNCLERYQSSEDVTFVALVHWMDETLVCEELQPLSSQLSPPYGFLFLECSPSRMQIALLIFLNKLYLGNQAYLFGSLRYPTQWHSRRHYVVLPAFMFIFDFGWHSSKACIWA